MGEEIAAEHLRKNGFKILSRNFRVGRLGEIDIIAREKDYICFIEVKTRRNNSFGSPAEAVGRSKQESIIKLANIYLSRFNSHNQNVRFDVAEVFMSKDNSAEINLIRNAF